MVSRALYSVIYGTDCTVPKCFQTSIHVILLPATSATSVWRPTDHHDDVIKQHATLACVQQLFLAENSKGKRYELINIVTETTNQCFHFNVCIPLSNCQIMYTAISSRSHSQ